jgi:uncharacterized flavoprotein (TIGR03862 family)
VKRAVAAIIGAGPAGLRAAEVFVRAGYQARVYEQKPSLGRKFLIAGRGGLNITHSEPADSFASRYDSPERWEKLLERFTPAQVRAWFEELGVPTFIGTSGRVFPRSHRAPAILEKWLERLDGLGCELLTGYRFHQLLGQRPFDIVFQRGKDFPLVTVDAVVFAVGGASWPQTGSDGNWVEEFRSMGIQVNDFIASNVGWERPWSKEFLALADGRPLKNLAVTCAGRTVRGELMVTKYGLEGGALYQLSRELRRSQVIEIDFRPDLTVDDLQRRWRKDLSLQEGARKALRLSTAAFALIHEVAAPSDLSAFLSALKRCRVKLDRPRPIDEAISSAGGVAWDELNEELMLRKYPGIFCAGEMIDWDAPTGGYLLQGCFVTGTMAGEGAANWIAQNSEA